MFKKIPITIITLLLFTMIAKAQHFSMTEIITNEFPKVSTNFLALKADGNSYMDLTVDDFLIEENGVQIPKELYELNCGIPPISVVLVLDQSNSMNEYVDGEKRWDWVDSGVRSFIDAIDLSDSISKVAIIGFGGKVYPSIPFTGDKDLLYDALDKMSALNASTNFNEAFLDQENGAIELLKQRPPEYRRVIVFLTDGRHESMTAKLRYNDILDRHREWNIQTYAITLLDDMNPDLNNIADYSGGDYFQIMNKYELSRIYELIARDAQGKIQCTLSWPSELSCAEVSSFRTVKINFLRNNKILQKNYKAPNWSIVSVDTDEDIYDFGDPEPGDPVVKEIQITPRQYPFDISDIKLIPDQYFEVDWGEGYGRTFNSNLFVNDGVTRTFKVRFTQQDYKALRRSTLVLEGFPCPLEIPLIGGAPSLQITQPNEGDIFSPCDNIMIRWTGNDANERVNLLYTINNGPWRVIRNNVSGNSFNWTPPMAEGKIKIRAQIVTQSIYKWAVSGGGEGDVSAATINIQNNDLYGVVCGTFNGETQIEDYTMEVFGENDIYLAKYDTEGNVIWAQSAGSVKNDNTIGALIDPIGDIYMSGTTHKGTKFERIFPSAQYDFLPYVYLAKYSPVGEALRVVTFGGAGKYDRLEVYALRMSYEFDMVSIPKIVIEGRYKGSYQQETNNWLLPNTDRYEKFFLVYDHNLNLLNVTTENVEMTNIVSDTDYDNQGNRFQTESFSGTRNFGSYQVSSEGGQDYYLNKFGPTGTSVDVSGEFNLSMPKLDFVDDIYNVGSCLVGDTCLKSINKFLINHGEFPVLINDAYMAGEQPDEFILLTEFKDSVIAPGDSIDIQIDFNPLEIGFRTAELHLDLDCISNISLTFEGEGICDAEVVEVIDFGQIYLGKKESIITSCIFKNPTSLEIRIEPMIDGENWDEFRMFRTKDGELLDKQTGPITVLPDSCIEILIEFTPKDFGIRKAFIDYKMPLGCQKVYTELIGEGIDAELMADGIDWYERRVNSINDSTITILNDGIGNELVSSINLEDESLTDIFELNSYGDVNISIAGNSEFTLDISFNPQQEIIYSTNIIVTVDSKEEPLKIPIRGVGILPKLETNYSCGEAVMTGESTSASLVVSNPSLSAPLKIDRIIINEGLNEFSWPNNIEPQDITVGINDSKIFDLVYTPLSGEPHSTEIVIVADNYDGTYVDEWKFNRIPIECDAFDVEFTDPLTFNNILVCNTAENYIEVFNNSVSTSLTLVGSQKLISGADSDNFSVLLDNDIIIEPSDSYKIPVQFTPDIVNKINYSATLSIPTSFNSNIVVSLLGDAKKMMTSSDKIEYVMGPGTSFQFPVNLNIPALGESSEVINNQLQKVNIQLIYNNKMLRYKENTIKSNLNNWIWDEPFESSPGVLEIKGNGNIDLPFDKQAFEIEFLVLLDLNDSTEILARIDYECASDEMFMTMLRYDEFCFAEGRRIIASPDYSVSLINNVVSEQIELEVFLANDAPTEIELHNSLGQTIYQIENDYLESGAYNFRVSTSDIPSGLYFINIHSGPYFDTKSVLILK